MFCFFFKGPAPTEHYTYGHTHSLHDALPISLSVAYQKHRHRVLGCSPDQRLAGNVAERRIADADLARAFFVEVVRKSHPKTGEVQLPNGRFRVPLNHADRKSTRLNSSHYCATRMPSSD